MRKIFICVLFLACEVLAYTSAAYFDSDVTSCTGKYTCSSGNAVDDPGSVLSGVLFEGDLYDKHSF